MKRSPLKLARIIRLAFNLKDCVDFIRNIECTQFINEDCHIEDAPHCITTRWLQLFRSVLLFYLVHDAMMLLHGCMRSNVGACIRHSAWTLMTNPLARTTHTRAHRKRRTIPSAATSIACSGTFGEHN